MEILSKELRLSHLRVYLLLVPVILFAAACSKDAAPLNPGTPGAAGPTLDSPSDDQQLETLRPTLTVVNSAATAGSGARTYEFQIAADNSFATLSFSKTGVAEGTGKTSLVVDQDLPSTTRLYWRSRLTRGTSSSDWSPTGRFRTKPVGRIIAGELFDPLTGGETVGTIVGSTTFIAGKGIRFNDNRSFVRYALPQSVVNGEFSMEVEGLRPNGPAGKPKIFQITDRQHEIPSSSFSMINAQYRGTPGNPDNSIAFKAILGNHDSIVEPELGERNNSIRFLDPSKTYFWQATWTNTTFRLVVKEGGVNGTEIYNVMHPDTSGTGLSSPQLFAFVGTNYEHFDVNTGTFPGMIVRNVWLSSKPRPASIGSASR